jgi:hypothetical protein
LNETDIEAIRSALFDTFTPNVTTPTGMVLNRQYFVRREDINATHPVVSFTGCRMLCPPESLWYKDIGQRITMWLLPVVLIIFNYEVTPQDKYKYLELFHLIGDPIDTNLSLLTKAEAWRACHFLAQDNIKHLPGQLEAKELGTILAAIFEVTYYGDPFDALKGVLPSEEGEEGEDSKIKLSEDEVQFLRDLAHKIADSRTNSIMRTLFFIALYGLQVLSAFLAILGGGIQNSQTPPGGRIAIAMLLTCFITPVLLSNAIGGYTTRRSCFNLLRDLVARFPVKSGLGNDNVLIQRIRDPRTYFENQRWRGGTDGYQPKKDVPFGSFQSQWRRVGLLVLASAPILTAFATGTVILWYSPPNGFNCRSLLIFAITIAWFFSYFLNWITLRTGFFVDRAHWIFVLVKDLFFGLSIVSFCFLSSCGFFNDCGCWSDRFWLRGRACVPLNWREEYVKLNSSLYPGLSVACVIMQVAIFFVMLAVEWRGFSLMRWSEQSRQGRYAAVARPLSLKVSNNDI